MNRIVFIALAMTAAGLMGCLGGGGGGGAIVITPNAQPARRVAKAPRVIAKPGPPAHAKAHGRRKKAKCYYYPSHQIYRSTSGSYYWYESGSWKIGVKLPSRIVLRDGDVRVELDLDAAEPYRTHEHVAKAHPGKANGKGKGPKKTPPGQSKSKGKGKGKSKGKDK
jgi:hypothetical protein